MTSDNLGKLIEKSRFCFNIQTLKKNFDANVSEISLFENPN